MNRIALAALLIAAAPALAAPLPGAVTIAPGGKVVIAAPPCDALVPGADYVPGVDVDGHAVAPADLPSPRASIDASTAAIEIDGKLAGRFGAGSAGARVGKMVLGTVTVRNGRAYFNGAPLAADANDAVIAACRAVAK